MFSNLVIYSAPNGRVTFTVFLFNLPMYEHQIGTVLVCMYIVFPHLSTLAVLFSPSGMVYSQFLPIKILPTIFLLKLLGPFWPPVYRYGSEANTGEEYREGSPAWPGT